MNWKDFITWRKAKSANADTPDTQKRKVLEKEKEEATKKGIAWVAVLDTHVDPKNIRNGFFELDWNNQFIEELLDAGYTGETNEEIVEEWFKTIASQILQETR